MGDQKQIIKDWIKEQLSLFLKFDVPDEMAEVALSLESDKVDDHFRGLLGHKDGKTRKFIAEFIKRRKACNLEPVPRRRFSTEFIGRSKQYIVSEDDIGFNVPAKKPEQTQEKSSKNASGSKKKNKFVNLYNKKGDTVMLKGRYLCNCESKKHKLINNCLTCGRIVCEQEGSGPCFVCDTLVCTPEEQMIFNGDTGKASKLYEQLLMREKPKGLEDAIKQRDKLLECDKNTKKHTHVFDDDSDYYCSANPWLTIEEREKFRKQEEEFFNKKNESRRDKKIVLNLETGGKVPGVRLVEEKENKPTNPTSSNQVIEYDQVQESGKQLGSLDSVDHILDPYFANCKIKFTDRLKKQPHNHWNPPSEIHISHVMDNELQKLTDQGCCLSVHQPYASLLVNGIRNAEGRTWYTSYRGKLWIASTGVRLSRQDAVKYENTYRLIKGDIKFPADYPSGCLIGSVDLVDCLTQEQYRSEYPDGELEDPYVFICENPQALPVRYPMNGKPNIYKLDEKIHTAAKMCLRTVEKVLSESSQKVKSFRP